MNFFGLGYHDDEKCNICGVTYIVGFVYKCVDCLNFNVCRRCEKSNYSKCVAGETHSLFRFADPLSLNVRNSNLIIELSEVSNFSLFRVSTKDFGKKYYKFDQLCVVSTITKKVSFSRVKYDLYTFITPMFSY